METRIDRDQEARVVAFLRSAALHDLPAGVIRQARRCVIDLLACSFAGIAAKTSRVAREFVTSFGGRPECSLFGGRSLKVPLPLAVLANTTICEALDGDDGYNLTKGHPGAFLLPVLLAFAERDRLTGQQVLEALVAGYEVGMRAGLISHAVNPAYHGSGSWGGIGTAAVAARCLRLDPSQTGHALGAAEYHGTMAPIMRCVEFPGMTKDGIGWSAFAGVSAALLAQRGFTSSPSLFALEEASDRIASLGERFLIMDLYFKPYCCCRWAHAPVRATLQVVRTNRIDPRSIERVVVETFAEACRLSRSVPASSEEAQYNVAYPVAAALVHGDVGPEQILEGGYSDSRTIDLMSRIEFRERPDLQMHFPARRLAEVTISASGRTFSSGLISARGEVDDPLTDAEIHDKFRRYTSPYLASDEAGSLLSDLERLEELPDLSALIRRLTGPESVPSEHSHLVREAE